jgi:hypothetical protein
MKDYKEKSLIDVLSYCDLRDLPEADKKEYVWVRAVALVEKRDGTLNYAVAKANAIGDYAITKDFGSISSIVTVKQYFPYEFLDATFLPDFKGAKKEDRINWLVKNGVNKDFSSMTAKDLDKECTNFAIKQQLNKVL